MKLPISLHEPKIKHIEIDWRWGEAKVSCLRIFHNCQISKCFENVSELLKLTQEIQSDRLKLESALESN